MQALCAAVLVVALAACGQPRVHGIATIEELDAPLKSAIQSREAMDEPQFVSGFYPVERDGWRWSRGHFVVVLLAPESASARGAILELKMDAPQVVLDQVGPVTIRASVGGVNLDPETRSRPGIYSYRRMVPAAAFHAPEALFEFTLDRVVKPFTTPAEDRELGVAVHGVALLPIGVAGVDPATLEGSAPARGAKR